MQYNTKLITGIILVLVFGLATGCKNNSSKKLSEGTITYSVTYLTKPQETPVVAMLPRKMVTQFKNNNTITTVKGHFNYFEFTFITKYSERTKYTLLRILDNKYVYKSSLDEPPIGWDKNCKIEIFKTDSTTIFNNLHCKVAKVYCPKIDKDTFDILYTNDINVKSPNTNNLYKDIDGVLVRGKLELIGIVMLVEIKEIDSEPVDDKVFEVPADYKPISRDSLEAILKSFEYKK